MQQKPIFLNVFQIKFPLPAIISILHRISGIFLFFLIPLLLYVFEYSVTNESYFNQIKLFFTRPISKCIIFFFGACLLYHLLAGIRHLIMDFGFAETKIAGKITATITLIVFIVLLGSVGVCLW